MDPNAVVVELEICPWEPDSPTEHVHDSCKARSALHAEVKLNVLGLVFEADSDVLVGIRVLLCVLFVSFLAVERDSAAGAGVRLLKPLSCTVKAEHMATIGPHWMCDGLEYVSICTGSVPFTSVLPQNKQGNWYLQARQGTCPWVVAPYRPKTVQYCIAHWWSKIDAELMYW